MMMTASNSGLSNLTNPLASSIQLETSASQLDGLPRDLEDSIRYETARLLQAAGILLRLPQDLVAQSIIILYRFWVGPDGGSMLEHDSTIVAAACLYLIAKPSAHAVTPSQTLITFSYLDSIRPNYSVVAKQDGPPEGIPWQLTEGDLETGRNRLYQLESLVLRVLGFQTHVALPFSLCINYLQTLDVSSSTESPTVAKTAFAHLNSALLSPQLLYLTHQPSVIATAAIYLAARDTGVSLPETQWWEVFDVDREDLGFVVLALKSVESFAAEEKHHWRSRKVPLIVGELHVELERRAMLENGH